jgi:hypothetical protein
LDSTKRSNFGAVHGTNSSKKKRLIRTRADGTGHTSVCAKRDSIAAHLPYLFTFQRFPDLNIPNTTNSLDGKFAKAKTALAVHSGLTHAHQIRLVFSILFARR